MLFVAFFLLGQSTLSGANNPCGETLRPSATTDTVPEKTTPCPDITSATFVESALALHSATFAVSTTASPTGYWITYTDRRTGATSSTYIAIANVVNDTLVLTELPSSRRFTGYIYSVCGTDTSLTGYPITFRTGCEPIADLPYLETFNYYSTTQLPACWTFLNAGNNHPKAYISSPFYGAEGGNCLTVTSSQYTILYVVLNEFQTHTSELAIRFSYINTYSNTNAYPFYLGVMTDPNDASTFRLLEYIPNTRSFNTLRHHFANDNLSPDTTYYITFRYNITPYGNGYQSYLENIRVYDPGTCPDPQNLHLVNTSFTTATIAWTDTSTNNAAISWDIYYGPWGFNADSVTPLTVNDTTVATITGLRHSSQYECFVVAHCADSATSVGSERLRFATDSTLVITTRTNSTSSRTMGRVNGGGTYHIYDTVTLTAIPSSGYHFATWQDGVTSNSRRVTALTDTTFTAIFAEGTLNMVHDTVHIVSYTHDTIWTPHIDSVAQLYHDTLTTILYDTVVTTIHDTLINSLCDTIVNTINDTTLLQPTYHTLTVQSADNSIGMGCGTGFFPEGSIVEIVGLPEQGFQFLSWEDGNTDNPRQITLNSTASYIATFDFSTYEESPELQHISVYPISTTGIYRISTHEVLNTTVYNSRGQKVLVAKGDTDINLSLHPADTYTLRIILPQVVAIRKVVKE